MSSILSQTMTKVCDPSPARLPAHRRHALTGWKFSGLGLLSFDGSMAVPAAVLPATQPAASDLDNLVTGGQGLEFLYATGNALWRFAYRYSLLSAEEIL